MTRSLTWCALFLSSLVLQACGDVSIGGDGVRRDGSADGPSADLVRDLPTDLALDTAPDTVICSGANPAARTCRATVNDCIPSSCSCSADGFWHCTADCPVNVPLCADGGAPEVAPDGASDLAPDAATCSGASPAARTCRQTANDCIPSTCSCEANGLWRCTADCRTSLPLCTDGGARDLAPDQASDLRTDAGVTPTDEQSCLKATNVGICDIWSPYGTITSATVGPLLANVEVTAGPCTVTNSCVSGCQSISVVGQPSISAGSTCDLLVTSTDGRSKSIRLSVVANPSPSHMCCGYPADGHGIWTAVNALAFQPNPVLVDFASDSGVDAVDGAKDVGADRAETADLGGEAAVNPCANCTATEVCVQWFDGMCHTTGAFCRPVSESCRSKLSAAGGKSCKSLPECDSEFCVSPYQCKISPPCGTEAPEAAMYCYGP